MQNMFTVQIYRGLIELIVCNAPTICVIKCVFFTSQRAKQRFLFSQLWIQNVFHVRKLLNYPRLCFITSGKTWLICWIFLPFCQYINRLAILLNQQNLYCLFTTRVAILAEKRWKNAVRNLRLRKSVNFKGK